MHFARKTKKIQKIQALSTFSKILFNICEIPTKFHQNLSKIKFNENDKHLQKFAEKCEKV